MRSTERRPRRLPTLAVAAVTAVLTLAGCVADGEPTRGDRPATSARPIEKVAPTALVLDASDSMLAVDAPGPRIDAARAAVHTLVHALPDDADLAVLAYGTGTSNRPADHRAGCRDVTTLVPRGRLDRSAVRAAVDGIAPRGFTPIAEALRRAADALPASGPSAIVLVSDGEDTCGAPPCPVAQELREQRPDLRISTVGFKTVGAAADTLRCIADAAAGLFVQADNAAQLRSRLVATQDASRGTDAVNGAALAGLTLGQSLPDIRRAHPDFPAGGRRDGERTIIEWHDCAWVFDASGALVEFAPGPGVRTIDGVGSGSRQTEAVEFYGAPLEATDRGDGTRELLFRAEAGGDTGYRFTVRGEGDDATIIGFRVCRCAGSTGTQPDGPAAVTIRPVDRDGSTTAGWLKDTTADTGGVTCESVDPVPGVTDPGLYWCSGPAGMNQGVCAPTVGGASMLCTVDAFSRTLRLLTPTRRPTATPRPAPGPIPYGVEFVDGTRCTLVAVWGQQLPNRALPEHRTRYRCGGRGTDALFVWATDSGFPFDRTSSGWTGIVGTGMDAPNRTVAVRRVVYVGLGS